jgi:hypothetical protein
VRDGDQVAQRTVGVQPDRSELAGTAGGDDECPGTVAEEAGGAAVVVVDDPAQ